ncbi:MAG: C10 family peptidase [Paludibacteraceae bacterium]
MKIQRQIVVLLLSLNVLVACNNMIDQSFQIDIKESAEQSISSTIPLEEALKSLDNVLVSVGQDVANVDKQSIVSLSHCDMALVAPKKFLKKTSATMTRDTLLYMVNFKDGGYAVLAADRHLPDDVLIITEHGTISRETFLSSIADNSTAWDTISFYNTTDEDYYVGAVSSLVNMMVANYTDKYYTKSTTAVDNIRYEYSAWTTTDSATSCITNTKWSQGKPYNRQCKQVGNDYVPAGCVPIAIAQMFAALERPTLLDDLTLNWGNIKEKDKLSEADTEVNNVAMMIAKIGTGCHTWYTTSFGMTTPTAVATYLQSLPDFTNVIKHKGYDDTLILEMLRHNKPIVLTAFRDAFHAHGWLIDGYRNQLQICTKYKNNQKVSETYKSRLLLHCNWGWGGTCNGYYVSGIFDANTGPIEVDSIDASITTTDKAPYDMWFRIITYDLQ